MLTAEHRAEPAERADDLVGHEQHAVAVADLAAHVGSSRRAAGSRPPTFCSGSRKTAATVSGPSIEMRCSIRPRNERDTSDASSADAGGTWLVLATLHGARRERLERP